MSAQGSRDVRERAARDLKASEVLMVDGHFDYGNGYHGRVYLNPHQLFLHPSTIWRAGQDLLELLPHELVTRIDVVAGPVTGGALLAHTLAGLLDGRRSLDAEPTRFAPFNLEPGGGLTLRRFYAERIKDRRVLLADDVRNTGKTFERCAGLVEAAGATVIGTVAIYDRLEAKVDLGVPNVALVSYPTTDTVRADECPMCRAGQAVTTF
jgi:orotate phosphoribosyltransferase